MDEAMELAVREAKEILVVAMLLVGTWQCLQTEQVISIVFCIELDELRETDNISSIRFN